MVITNERIEMIAATLIEDADFANELFAMNAEDAAAALAAKGFAVSAEELAAFAVDLQAYLETNEELDEDALEDVNGGCRPHPHHHHHHHHHHHCHHHHFHHCRPCRW